MSVSPPSTSTSAATSHHTPRWGTLDGPDDAIETYWNWTLLHALGGSDSVLDLYRKAQEGHWRQYGELRTKLTELAANGAYSKEFITGQAAKAPCCARRRPTTG